MKSVRILSGGAAQGLVEQVQERFLKEHGCKVEGSFAAVGAMRDKLLSGEPCDLMILTGEMISALASSGLMVANSARALGMVNTGVAVKAGAPLPDVSSPKALEALLRDAPGIYVPDPQKATAGIHFMKVLRMLGLEQEVAGRLRPFPNGATAMREMAAATGDGLVGCTQVTEILYTPGVRLAGMLPKKFELQTMYTAAVCSRAAEPAAAAALIALLAGDEARAQREAGGFERL
ncbi:MAG: ABC transporter substrate-binding protein [Burkholderiales bacterium]|nr:MAG: ABC transporter substrate-binding protein [Burkholderiales bacterium]